MIVKTKNSTYEVIDNKIRRLYGTEGPTVRQGDDGDWKEFMEMLGPEVGKRMCIIWKFTEDLVAQTTQTSVVIEILETQDMN